MSREGKWTIILAVVAILVALVGAIGTWKGVMQSKDYHGGFMPLAVVPIALLVIVLINGYALYRNLRDANRCKKLEQERREQRKGAQFVGGEAALLSFFQEWATELVDKLEQLWHRWNAQGEVLLHPISMTAQDWKDFSKKEAMGLIAERRDFTTLYAYHIVWIASQLPKFESAITRTGYPS